ncbi:hypothetical protein CPB84DRAFT_1747549 [Gymnopilus junonius]|uniref:Uncharacterized protein n=1 Tax=Gymnopilus junonius TaxID=109634 RepID=A0A9P5NKK8_GYMJU|nr:hypothetical protein CPB84DRAFT_1747549 [Gymnopilus junonius]
MDILKTLQKSRPDKNKDRVAWNASWELELKIQYEGMEGSVTKAPIVNSTAKTPQISPQASLNEERMKIHICELEEDLVKMALEHMNSNNFEAKWKGLPQKWCLDITVENPAGNSGQGYIDMLKMLFHQDGNVQVTEPTIIHHAGLDRYFMKSQGFIPPEISKYRAFFMDLTMWRILLAFYGGKEDWIIYKGIQEGSDSKKRRIKIGPRPGTQSLLEVQEHQSWVQKVPALLHQISLLRCMQGVDYFKGWGQALTSLGGQKFLVMHYRELMPTADWHNSSLTLFGRALSRELLPYNYLKLTTAEQPMCPAHSPQDREALLDDVTDFCASLHILAPDKVIDWAFNEVAIKNLEDAIKYAMVVENNYTPTRCKFRVKANQT